MKGDALRANAVRLGFACFIALNAVTIWPGALPFSSGGADGVYAFVDYSLLQGASFCGTLFLLGALPVAFDNPLASRRRHFAALAGVALFGSILVLLVSIRFGGIDAKLLYAAVCLLGISSATYYVLWQQVFALQELDTSASLLFSATALSALLSVTLDVIPASYRLPVAASLLIPVGAVCLWVSQTGSPHKTDVVIKAQTQVGAVEIKGIARLFLKEMGGPLVCMVAMALVSGLARALSITASLDNQTVNRISTVSLFVSALVLLIAWRCASEPLAISSWYQWVFPVLATGFLLLPFFGRTYAYAFVGATYLTFSLVSMLMMLTCTRFAKSAGINAVVPYGITAGCFYLAHMLGYLTVSLTTPIFGESFIQVTVLSLFAVYLLAVILLTVKRTGVRQAASLAEDSTAPPGPMSAQGGYLLSNDADLIEKSGISQRELEIMELLLTGRDIPYIAETLCISQNTARTHNKGLYRKLNIHSRRELFDLQQKNAQKSNGL
jgi:DNA-binding CsgD family transcriptional regulator